MEHIRIYRAGVRTPGFKPNSLAFTAPEGAIDVHPVALTLELPGAGGCNPIPQRNCPRVSRGSPIPINHRLTSADVSNEP